MIAAAAALAAPLHGCGDGNAGGAPTAPAAPTPSLSSGLQAGCLGWPAADFSPSNHASVRTSLAAGQRAIDFALRDPGGATYRLSELLASRPVLLVHGSFT
jgi:hypothetical protein